MGTVRSELLHTTHQPCINSLSLLLCWLLAALRSPSTLPALLVSPILVLPAWPILILTLTITPLWSTLPPLPPPSYVQGAYHQNAKRRVALQSSPSPTKQQQRQSTKRHLSN